MYLLNVLVAWRDLTETGISSTFGRHDLNKVSRLLSPVIASLPTARRLTEELFSTLEQLCIYLAIREAPDALVASLALVQRQFGVKAVDHLFYRFHAEWARQFEDNVSLPTLEPSAHRDDLLSHLSSPAVAQHATEPRRVSDMIAIMIAAHARPPDFQGIMRSVLDLGYQLSMRSYNYLLPSLGLEPPHLDTARHYFEHARTALLAQDHTLLLDEIRRLGDKSAHLGLERLYSIVIEGLGDEYAWAMLPSLPKPGRTVIIDEQVFAQFITSFYRLRRLNTVERIWDDLTRLGHKPGVVVWTALIHGAGQRKGTEYAQHLWNSMIAAGVRPDIRSYHALISIYVHNKRMREATERLAELEASLQQSLPGPDEPSLEQLYNVMVFGYLQAKQHNDALALIERMKRQGPTPTVTTYNTLMAHYNRLGDYKAVSWVMKKIAAEGLQGDAYTYSTLLSALLAVGKRDDAVKRVLNIMRKHDVQPNVVTYSTIIAHLLEQRVNSALFAALDILRWMEACGQPDLAPTVITYTNVLQALHSWTDLPTRAVEDHAARILREMRARSLKLTRVAYNMLIKACLWNSRPEGLRDGLRYFRDMQTQRVKITADTWYLLTQGLVLRREWELAGEIVGEMMQAEAFKNEEGGRRRWLLKLAQRVTDRQDLDDIGLDSVYDSGH
ncbi:hypothetical protein K488DRAFT_45841 [Vararia minispora EC-137]|uniref:Uncharacterized protein n=1 Tax=Vararia minispora EC-137 TaxID=1314806 RepID=A0ACB8QRF5_9AGAM|nr:hypothetical protein K488DRAFT_45841 [Vararia minispora EC-137]